ncbi:MAG TPA: ABC transporter ATP-binding protein [Tissierellaceae bacterium]
MIVIKAEDVDLGYKDKVIVKNANLEINQGQIVSIIGPNGSGKSTLLKGLSRIIKPLNGRITLYDEDILSIPTREVAKKIAILPQVRNIASDVTVEKLVTYGRHPHMKFGQKLDKKNKDIVDWAIETTKLERLRKRYVNTLSGGEGQRAWIAMALAQNPKVLLLDEPTTFLDIAHQLDVLETIKKLNKELNLTVIMVLHDINQAVRYSDTICAVKDGNIVNYERSCNIITDNTIEDIFEIEGTVYKDIENDCPFFIPQRIINS